MEKIQKELKTTSISTIRKFEDLTKEELLVFCEKATGLLEFIASNENLRYRSDFENYIKELYNNIEI